MKSSSSLLSSPTKPILSDLDPTRLFEAVFGTEGPDVDDFDVDVDNSEDLDESETEVNPRKHSQQQRRNHQKVHQLRDVGEADAQVAIDMDNAGTTFTGMGGVVEAVLLDKFHAQPTVTLETATTGEEVVGTTNTFQVDVDYETQSSVAPADESPMDSVGLTVSALDSFGPATSNATLAPSEVRESKISAAETMTDDTSTLRGMKRRGGTVGRNRIKKSSLFVVESETEELSSESPSAGSLTLSSVEADEINVELNVKGDAPMDSSEVVSKAVESEDRVIADAEMVDGMLVYGVEGM
jgi:hypothetical protein